MDTTKIELRLKILFWIFVFCMLIAKYFQGRYPFGINATVYQVGHDYLSEHKKTLLYISNLLEKRDTSASETGIAYNRSPEYFFYCKPASEYYRRVYLHDYDVALYNSYRALTLNRIKLIRTKNKTITHFTIENKLNAKKISILYFPDGYDSLVDKTKIISPEVDFNNLKEGYYILEEDKWLIHFIERE